MRVAGQPRADIRRGHRALLSGFSLSLLVLLTLSYFFFGTHKNWRYKVESDGRYYYQYLVSLFFDGDLDFTNNYRAPTPAYMYSEIDLYNMKAQVSPLTNRPTNYFTIGPAILWSPFFVTAYAAGALLNALLNAQIDLDPWGLYLQYATMFSAVLYGLVTLYLLYRLLQGSFSSTASKLTILLVLFATNLYYYTVFESSMSHVYDLFTYAVLIFLFQQIVSGKTSVYLYAALGITAGLHVLVRTQNAATGLIFAALLLWFLVRRKSSVWDVVTRYGVFLVLFAFASAPVLLVNIYLYGMPFIVPQGTTFLQPLQPHVLEVLFSLRNGLFSHHPVLLVGLFGFTLFLCRSIKHDGKFKLLAIGLMLAFLAQLYINSIAFDWWAGVSFGQRRFISSLPLFAFGIAEILALLSKRAPSLYARFAPAGVLVLCLAGVYLALIHVFLWDYEQPHNILSWMFFDAPRMMLVGLK